MSSVKDTGWAEMFLPLQSLEVGSVQIGDPKPILVAGGQERSIAEFKYKTPIFSLPTLSILTPFCKVHAWDSTTGRLDVEVEAGSQFIAKLTALQEYCIQVLNCKPTWLPPAQRNLEAIRANFQALFHGPVFTIFLHGSNPERRVQGRVWSWSASGGWQKGVSQGSFKKGQQVRLGLRFNGLYFLPVVGGVKHIRLQHQVVSVYHKAVSSLM